jgi:hypothetical protein
MLVMPAGSAGGNGGAAIGGNARSLVVKVKTNLKAGAVVLGVSAGGDAFGGAGGAGGAGGIGAAGGNGGAGGTATGGVGGAGNITPTTVF